LKKATNVAVNSAEIMRAIKDWPSYYHLSPARSNILRVLDLSPSAKILELGCGCGAVTRYLGENLKEVDAVEGSLLRSRITKERCRDLKNVRVFCSDIKNLKIAQNYDMVTLIGVLEYAPVYFQKNSHDNADETCLSLLKFAKSFLKPDGILILAIENKLGLKYLSGCPDDHTGEIYDGINGYPVKGKPITFSKKELTQLLEAAGFAHASFYYCFPDYKFASVVISDTAKKTNYYLYNWIDIPFESYGPPRDETFHEGLALRTLARAGLLREFSNSFLIVASPNKLSLKNPVWLVKKLTSFNRRPEYRCLTTLKAGSPPYVEKVKLLKGEDSVRKNVGNFSMVHQVTTTPWYAGDLWIYELYESLFYKNCQELIFALLQKYYQELLARYSAGTKDKENFPLLRGEAFDFILRNIIKREKDFILIDPEWRIEECIPIDYVMYRCIFCDIAKKLYFTAKNRVNDPDRFSFKLLKKFFPHYDKNRHLTNQVLEQSFQDAITMNYISLERALKIKRLPFLRRRKLWNIAKMFWDKLPAGVKNLIRKYLIES